MICFTIPKRRGQVRYIHACSTDAERRMYRKIAGLLAKMERKAANEMDVAEVSHGFIVGRSVVTALRPHIGAYCTFSVDLSSWYDSVRTTQVDSLMDRIGVHHNAIQWLLDRAFIASMNPNAPFANERAPRQGLPSSPAAANMAAIRLDCRIKSYLSKLSVKSSYTRYADDLIISFHDRVDPGYVQDSILLVSDMIRGYGWQIAEHKTEVKWAKHGRRIFLGLSVGETDIKGSRKLRRRLRAATHQEKWKQALGLAAWYGATPPRCPSEKRRIIREALNILRNDASDDDDYTSVAIASDYLEENGFLGLSNLLAKTKRYKKSFYVSILNKKLSRLERSK